MSYKTLYEEYRDNAYEAIKYIVKNDCRLEHRSHLAKEDWKPGTLREMLKYVTGSPTDKTFFNWYLNFWRIKTKAEDWEIENIIKADKNED